MVPITPFPPQPSPGIQLRHIFQSSTYLFETHTKTEQIRLLDIKTRETSVISENPSYKEPTWIGDREILLLDVSASEEDVTSLLHWDLSGGGR